MRRQARQGKVGTGRAARGALRRLSGGVLPLLCALALLVQPVSAGAEHIPRLAMVLQDHAQMIAAHGHSHGLEEDLAWALHGHAHDEADHDHGQTFLPPAGPQHAAAPRPRAVAGAPPSGRAPPVFRRLRPPRA